MARPAAASARTPRVPAGGALQGQVRAGHSGRYSCCWTLPGSMQLPMPSPPPAVHAVQAVSDLVFECLHQDPAKRPTALQLLQRLGPLVDPPSLPAQPAPGGSSTGSGSGSSGGSGSGESPAPPYQPQAANAEPQAGPSATPGTTEAHSPASQRQWQLPSPFVAHAGVALPRQQQQQQ